MTLSPPQTTPIATIRVLFLALVLALLGCVDAAFAQTATPNDRVAWDDVGLTLAEANGASYQLEIDGTVTNLPAAAVTCTQAGSAAAPVCVTKIPALTPGTHTARVQWTRTVDGRQVTSGFSQPLTFTLLAIVPPSNLRLVP